MDIYNIIKKPVFTEKAMNLKEHTNKVVVEVHPSVNKTQIKKLLKRYLR